MLNFEGVIVILDWSNFPLFDPFYNSGNTLSVLFYCMVKSSVDSFWIWLSFPFSKSISISPCSPSVCSTHWLLLPFKFLPCGLGSGLMDTIDCLLVYPSAYWKSWFYWSMSTIWSSVRISLASKKLPPMVDYDLKYTYLVDRFLQNSSSLRYPYLL